MLHNQVDGVTKPHRDGVVEPHRDGVVEPQAVGVVRPQAAGVVEPRGVGVVRTQVDQAIGASRRLRWVRTLLTLVECVMAQLVLLFSVVRT